MEFKKRGSDTTVTGQINSTVNTECREHKSIFLIQKMDADTLHIGGGGQLDEVSLAIAMTSGLNA
jgi:hypothetical protein